MYLQEAIEKAQFYKKKVLTNLEIPYKLKLKIDEDSGIKASHGSGYFDWSPSLSELISDKWEVKDVPEKVEDLNLVHRVEKLEAELNRVREALLMDLNGRIIELQRRQFDCCNRIDRNLFL